MKCSRCGLVIFGRVYGAERKPRCVYCTWTFRSLRSSRGLLKMLYFLPLTAVVVLAMILPFLLDLPFPLTTALMVVLGVVVLSVGWWGYERIVAWLSRR